MWWVELLLVLEAGLSLGLSALNCAYFSDCARSAKSASRAVAAFALLLVNLGFALEAGLYVVVARSLGRQPLQLGAELLVRTVLLLAVGLMSALVLRKLSNR